MIISLILVNNIRLSDICYFFTVYWKVALETLYNVIVPLLVATSLHKKTTIANISVNDNDQLFERPLQNNHSVPEPSAHISLGSESLQYQDNKKTHRTSQKIPPPVKEYLSFKIEGESSHSAQCDKTRALTKVVGFIIKIESFDQKCVIIK